MDDVKSLGHNVYIAAGRVIAVNDDTFDASDPESKELLLNIGRKAFKEHWDKPWHGDLTVTTIGPLRDGPSPIGGRGRVAGFMHMGDLPEEVKAQLRKEFPGHASEI